MPELHPSQVRDFPFFTGVADEDLQAILRIATTRRIAKKSLAFEQGRPAREFFLLLNGHLKMQQTTPDGRQVVMRIVEPGEPYGLAVALGRPDYPASAVAMEESLTLVWPSSTWTSLVDRSPVLGANALKTLGQRVQEAHTRIREVSTEEVERRVAHLLLRMVSQSGRDPKEAVDIDFPVTRQEIAEMTGTTLFTVSRILSNWESQGIAVGGRERIGLRQPARLREIADRTPE
jgi:CRP-like cAMP-binding protein